MIIHLSKEKSRLAIIQNIPKCFFKRIEEANTFGGHLFPQWAVHVFRRTGMMKKFEAVYNKYKALEIQSEREKVVEAFFCTNQIEDLCCRPHETLMITLEDLPVSIQQEIKDLFEFLYKKAIHIAGFQNYVQDSVEESIERFLNKNKIRICPFCGLEGLRVLRGQARPALDHWLCQESFPMAAVNFNNLFPIGNACNASPVKGEKIVLLDSDSDKRIRAYYPTTKHGGIDLQFKYLKEPQNIGERDKNWELNLRPKRAEDEEVFKSWKSTMNIDVRYHDFFHADIFPLWEEEYVGYLEESGKRHADTVEELKNNLKEWKASWKISCCPGAILYRSFLDYLLNEASEAWLYGLCENLKCQK